MNLSFQPVQFDPKFRRGEKTTSGAQKYASEMRDRSLGWEIRERSEEVLRDILTRKNEQ